MSPDKPTRESATGTPDPRRLYDAEAGEQQPAPERRATGGREEKGGRASTGKHPPHTTESDREGRVGPETGADRKATPALPANAQGTDTATTRELDQEIREESMYDQRRDEDKDRPPSTRGA